MLGFWEVQVRKSEKERARVEGAPRHRDTGWSARSGGLRRSAWGPRFVSSGARWNVLK